MRRGVYMHTIKARTVVALSGLLAACAAQTQLADKSGATEEIFETNITNDLNITSGGIESLLLPVPAALMISATSRLMSVTSIWSGAIAGTSRGQ
jgi:hypothetical protein